MRAVNFCSLRWDGSQSAVLALRVVANATVECGLGTTVVVALTVHLVESGVYDWGLTLVLLPSWHLVGIVHKSAAVVPLTGLEFWVCLAGVLEATVAVAIASVGVSGLFGRIVFLPKFAW